MTPDWDEDVSQAVRDKFEWLAAKIPGLAEYRGRQGLRDQDRLIREAAADRIVELRRHIDGVKADLLNFGGLSWLDDLDALGGKLDALAGSLRAATAGMGGHVATSGVTREKLEAIIAHDRELLEQIEKATAPPDSGEQDAAARVAALRDNVAVLDRLVAARKRLWTTLT
ncbi:MAG: hypothetical protein IT350_17825 [Deltaproteobacteria bacterium]|nr:hypothetical protein [Deltaproteobacteria bacterium]